MSSTSKQNEFPPITYAILSQWKRDGLLLDEESSFLYGFEPEKKTQLPTIKELLIFFRSLHTYYQDSDPYLQVCHALDAAFNFDNIPWFQMTIDSIVNVLPEIVYSENTPQKREADNIFWVLTKFLILAESYVVRTSKCYHDAWILLIDFSKMLPSKAIEADFDHICQIFFTPFKASSADFLAGIQKTNFQQTFMLAFISDYPEFFNKINQLYASPETMDYVIPVACCLNIVKKSKEPWKSNLINTRLILQHPEKAKDLCVIFSQLYNYESRKYFQFTEEIYQTLMYPTVLNYLEPLKKAVFAPINVAMDGEKPITFNNDLHLLLDQIIFLDPIYPCLLAYLPKELIYKISIIFNLLNRTIPREKLLLDSNPKVKYIVLPLTDTMVMQLDYEDVQDLKHALPKFNMKKYKVFDKLSIKGFETLLKKLGEDFVRNSLGIFSTNMQSMLDQMTLDCQKAFYTYLGSEHILSNLNKYSQAVWHVLYDHTQALFHFVIDMLGSQDFIINTILNQNSFLWPVYRQEENYKLLGKIAECDRNLYDKSLEKLGKQWLIKTNNTAQELSRNLNYLDADSIISVISQIGSEHLQTIFPDFHSLNFIFQIKPSTTHATLLALLGDAYLAKLAHSPDAINGHATLKEVFKDIKTTANLLKILHIDGYFLMKAFPEPSDICRFHRDNTRFILHLECILPVCERQLGDKAFLFSLLYLIPKCYYSTFFAHLSFINKLPTWTDLETIRHFDQLDLYEALPDSIFIKNPIKIAQLKNLRGDIRLICLKKMPIDTLKDIVNNPDFVESICALYEKEVFEYLLEKLGANYLKSLSAKTELYETICAYLPSFVMQPLADNDSQNQPADIVPISLGRSRETLFATQDVSIPSADDAACQNNLARNGQ